MGTSLSDSRKTIDLVTSYMVMVAGIDIFLGMMEE